MIDRDTFNSYAMETAALFTELYGWYRMPPSVQRVLLDGAHCVSFLFLSAPTARSRQKYNGAHRTGHARKVSRTQTMQDQLHYLLINSNPEIVRIIQKDLQRKRKRRVSRKAPAQTADISHLLLTLYHQHLRNQQRVPPLGTTQKLAASAPAAAVAATAMIQSSSSSTISNNNSSINEDDNSNGDDVWWAGHVQCRLLICDTDVDDSDSDWTVIVMWVLVVMSRRIEGCDYFIVF